MFNHRAAVAVFVLVALIGMAYQQFPGGQISDPALDALWRTLTGPNKDASILKTDSESSLIVRSSANGDAKCYATDKDNGHASKFLCSSLDGTRLNASDPYRCVKIKFYSDMVKPKTLKGCLYNSACVGANINGRCGNATYMGLLGYACCCSDDNCNGGSSLSLLSAIVIAICTISLRFL